MPKNGRIENKEKKKVVGILNKFLKIFLMIGLFPVVAFGVQTPNPRGGNGRDAANINEVRTENAIRRSATSVIARSVEKNSRKNRPVVKARQNTSTSRNAVARNVRDTARVVTSSANVSRGALANKKTLGLLRAAKNNSVARSGVNVSRAGTARATAVFNDISKIGGGYAACRDSYATCMDQFCANANDTYRRCYCSDRFTSFRDTSDSLDAALSMLADFQNNNLEAVNKTAAEVSAMYSASEGEAAIKRDTSASQKLLDSIGDLLSGKKKYTPKSTSTAQSSIGTLNLSGLFSSTSNDDIFGGGSIFDGNGGSLFSNNSSNYENMADLEGGELYNSANRQCSAISHDECTSDAMFNLARSAYSIMITQDCNLYEKNINAKKESVQETVRTAEKYLREARLEEYRAHNSPDVNSCLDKVESAIRQSTACGENYERCLDYSGRYMNSVTGEPIYSKALFDLNNLIVLDGSADVVGANPEFNNFLEEKKIFVTQALDTCRSIADTVWYEFKRSAIIQIAQAQDAKIEEVKASCVETISECYNTQTGALDQLGGESIAKMTGAISAIAAHDMCKDQVLACAALYGDPNACVYNDKDKTLKDNGTGTCGLKSLLAYVNTVDSVKVAKGCETSIRDYAKELCASVDEEHEYPWGCRSMSPSEIKSALTTRAKVFCGQDLIKTSSGNNSGTNNTPKKPTIVKTMPKAEAIQVAQQEVQQIVGDKAAQHTKVVMLNRASQTAGASASVTGGSSVASGNTYTDIDQNIIGSVANPNKVISDLVADITESIQLELGTACMEYGGIWLSNSIQAKAIADIVSTKGKTLNEFYKQVFNSKIDSHYGKCMEITVMAECLKQNTDDKKYATYDEETMTCSFTDDWYKDRCISIGGIYNSSAGECYLPKSE